MTWPFVLLGTVLAYELLRSLVVRAVRQRQERAVDRFLHDHRIPTDPFRYTHRVAVREMVLSDAGLAAAIAERAAEEGAPVADVQRRVRAWLGEIVPHFNLLAYYRVGYTLGRLAAYSVYDVELDKRSLERAQAAIPEGAAVVYVSNHRSNADFVVTGFMLSRSVQVSYAVGEWARVWPLESLFKAFGSYFVRRGEKDPLYHRTLEAYVQLITKQGVTQAMFPEGGLTRDGALRPPKLGLLDTMARAKLDPAFQRPLVFVPVGINFDRVFEDEHMVREARGQSPDTRRGPVRKARRLAALTGKAFIGVPLNTVRFLTKRLKKHGVAAIHFGEPVVFDDWYRGQGPFLDDPDRHRRREALRPFAEDLMGRIGRAVPVTPTGLVCCAMVALGRARMEAGVDRGDLLIAMRSAADRFEAAGAPFALHDPARRDEREAMEGRPDLVEVAVGMGDAERLRRVLGLALDVLEGRKVLVQEDGRMRTERWDLVAYYARALEAHGPPVERRTVNAA